MCLQIAPKEQGGSFGGKSSASFGTSRVSLDMAHNSGAVVPKRWKTMLARREQVLELSKEPR